ncbi:MAG: hypothetical protein HEP71_07040 [Roseivirga sp.]|nr:hypothetical protein [Roseivirga sp.]
MKHLTSVFSILLLITICACSDIPAPDTCLDPENAESANWLQTIIDEMENDTSQFAIYGYITTGTYDGQRIFIIKNCCVSCSYVAPVYSCSGQSLGFLSYQGNGVHPDHIDGEELFWKRSDSVCTI